MDCGRKAWSTEKSRGEPSEEQTNAEFRKRQSRHCGTIHHQVTKAPKGAQYGTLKIPLSAKVTNDASRCVSGAYHLGRNTPDLSQTPFLTGLPGPAPLTSKRHPKTDLQALRDHRGRGTSFRRPFGTLRGSPSDVSVVANASW
ncbi:hypothetical protein CDL15_Pgr028803 [Punica granatum]|uniref:Uncharacterized protein n=1 Tax=Punica granatum TaxID=22663 RepID=A0A218VX78_PUNGR|nr:hypothetical protein CDL15_Pgr028803 [Punica granatum]